MPANPIAENFLRYSAGRFPFLLSQIDKCLARLTEEQIQHRSAAHENSIATLLVHLEGNIRQWILHGIAGQPDVRQRDAEFDITTTIPVRTSPRAARSDHHRGPPPSLPRCRQNASSKSSTRNPRAPGATQPSLKPSSKS